MVSNLACAHIALCGVPRDYGNSAQSIAPYVSSFSEDGGREINCTVTVTARPGDEPAALRLVRNDGQDKSAERRNKSVAEDHRRCKIYGRHRGHPSAGKPRRLIASSPKIPHSSSTVGAALKMKTT
jgi:hypothetical protein